MSVDLGIKNDGTAIAITHKDSVTGKIVLDYYALWFSASSDVWDVENSIYKNCTKYKDKELIKVGDIAKEIKDLDKLFPITSGVFDQNNGYALMEKLHEMGLKQFKMIPASDTSNHEIYQVFKTLYQDNQIVLPDNEVYIPELLSLQAEKIGKSKLKVAAPDKKGAHDDISDAIVNAIFTCYSEYHENPSKITSVVSNGTGRSLSSTGSDSSMSMHQMNKIMKHGIAPRNTKFDKKSSRFHR